MPNITSRYNAPNTPAGYMEAEYNAHAARVGQFSSEQLIGFSGNPDYLTGLTIDVIVQSIARNYRALRLRTQDEFFTMLSRYGIVNASLTMDSGYNSSYGYRGTSEPELRITDVVRRNQRSSDYTNEPYPYLTSEYVEQAFSPPTTREPMPAPTPVQPAPVALPAIETTPFPRDYTATLQREFGNADARALILKQLNLVNAVKRLTLANKTQQELVYEILEEAFNEAIANEHSNRVRAIVINRETSPEIMIANAINMISASNPALRMESSVTTTTYDGLAYRLRIKYFSSYLQERVSKDIFFIFSESLKTGISMNLSRTLGDSTSVYFQKSVDEVLKFCFSLYLNGTGSASSAPYVQRWVRAFSRGSTQNASVSASLRAAINNTQQTQRAQRFMSTATTSNSLFYTNTATTYTTNR